MSWLDPGHPTAALLGLLLGVASGWLVPRLIARLPEPADVDTEASSDAEGRPGLPPPVAKERYVDIAALPDLARKTALASGLVAAALAASVGWSWSLLFLLPLAPIGVALALIDWRTTLLPTRVVAPTYAITVAGILAAGVLDRDRDALVHAGLGWVIMGGLFFLLWFVYPRGLGYGDVRLSGVLGMALGYLGWAELVFGLYGAFLLGGLGGGLLGMLRVVNRKRFPFGPFMLVAALLAVVLAPWVADRLGY